MTIQRDWREGPITFECDDASCHEVLRTGEDDFGAARDELRGRGWKTRKVGADWMHFCADHDA